MISVPTLRTSLLAACFACFLSAGAAAGPFEDGVAALDRNDPARAVEIFRPLAEAGDVAAQYNLGLAYANGRGVERDDAKAVEWFRKAAAADYAQAELILGIMMTYGRGTPIDTVTAAKFFERAALHGNPNAQFSLGMAYQRGHGVPADPVQAAVLFRKAALQGYINAQIALAGALTDGAGVAVDLDEACMWLTLAIRTMPDGRPKDLTKGLREEIAKKMTPDRVASAEARADAFKAAPDPDAIAEGHLGDRPSGKSGAAVEPKP